VPEVYFHWIMTYLHEAKVEIITSHNVKRIDGRSVEIANVYEPSRVRTIGADLIVMATARKSENEIYHILRERGVSVEAIGCALAPRTVYEATLEGHRAARALDASQWTRAGRDMAQSHAPQYYSASS
jgi:predicted flavoprotein YhiN